MGRGTWRSAKKQLVVAVAAFVVFWICFALFVLIGDHGSGSGGKVGASSRASLSTFLRHDWWGHGRLFVIHRSGRGVERLRTYAPGPPY
jgi:hypothetical protein